MPRIPPVDRRIWPRLRVTAALVEKHRAVTVDEPTRVRSIARPSSRTWTRSCRSRAARTSSSMRPGLAPDARRVRRVADPARASIIGDPRFEQAESIRAAGWALAPRCATRSTVNEKAAPQFAGAPHAGARGCAGRATGTFEGRAPLVSSRMAILEHSLSSTPGSPFPYAAPNEVQIINGMPCRTVLVEGTNTRVPVECVR